MAIKVQLFSFLLLAAFSVGSIAEQLSSRVAPLAQNSLLLDIINVEDAFLIAVGERGHILMSTDGDNWQQQTVPTQATLTRVFFLNQNIGWVVGHDASILKTLDGGKSWQVQMYEPELQRPFFDVYFTDENNGLVVGAYGYQYRTNDGGNTWQREFSDSLLFEEDKAYLDELKADNYQAYIDEQTSILPHFNRIKHIDQTFYLAGEQGLIATSDAKGKNWTKLDEFYQGSFFDLEQIDHNKLILAGLRGNLFVTDENNEWQKVPLKTTALLNDIVKDQSHIIVLGNAGVWLQSKDNASTFSKHIEKDGKALIAGTFFKGRLIVSSEVGIKQLLLK